MQYMYEPYILRRAGEGRVFFVNGKMPFEFFVNCFQFEHPFFIVSQLEDGRAAIAPNVMCIPWNVLQAGFWPKDLLPEGFEYVTLKEGTYPVIITAHPLNNFEDWFRRFVGCVERFAKTTLSDFVASCTEYGPLQIGRFAEKPEITREKVLA